MTKTAVNQDANMSKAASGLRSVVEIGENSMDTDAPNGSTSG